MVKLLTCLISVLFWSTVLIAQTSALRGIVTDETGAVVPGAKVVLTPNTGKPNTVMSANDGSYSFAVAPGDYVLEASAPDLKSGPVKVTIREGTQVQNLQLKVALAAQQVTVEEHAATVTPEPANNASATVLAGNDLEALSDNPDDLINDLIAIAGPGAGSGGASVFIDGFTGGLVPSKEAIREIR